ncbi:MAG: protein-L-isoaspartate O-methyltransferase, partial [Thermoplasmata archaeon]
MNTAADRHEERKKLVEMLVKRGDIQDERVIKAMLEVKRHLFVPAHLQHLAYVDSPLEIGYGQTISAPHMVAIMAEKLCLREGHKVLEIGAGSGYHAAVVAHIVGESGHVYSVERVPELANFARENIRKAALDKRVTVVVGDGSKGLPKYAPYDRIYATCAAPEIPKPLIE